MKKIILSTILLFSFFVAIRAYDFTIAKDGSGDFTTVQAAINAVPDFRKKRTTIFIKNGIYKEKLVLASSKTNVTFIGEDVKQTILTYDDYASKKNIFGEEKGTTGSTSFYIFGDNFTAENVTLENSAGPVGQAVAVRIDGNQVAFKNCRFLGFQDTLYPHGENSKQYYKNCYIEGTVDFIFGWSTALFDECTIFCKNKGYVTAPSTNKETKFGLIFLNCNITGDAAAHTFYLGRPWRPYGQSVFVNCKLGKHIKPEGWHNWSSTEKEKTAFFAEFNNSGEGASTSLRVDWSKQLSAKEAAKYTPTNILGNWIEKPDLFISDKIK